MLMIDLLWCLTWVDDWWRDCSWILAKLSKFATVRRRDEALWKKWLRRCSAIVAKRKSWKKSYMNTLLTVGRALWWSRSSLRRIAITINASLHLWLILWAMWWNWWWRWWWGGCSIFRWIFLSLRAFDVNHFAIPMIASDWVMAFVRVGGAWIRAQGWSRNVPRLFVFHLEKKRTVLIIKLFVTPKDKLMKLRREIRWSIKDNKCERRHNNKVFICCCFFYILIDNLAAWFVDLSKRLKLIIMQRHKSDDGSGKVSTRERHSKVYQELVRA